MEKSSEIDLNISDSQFLEWLIKRLSNVHGYSIDNDIINRLSNISKSIELYNKKCSDDDLDKIISQYFVDFFLTKDETTSIGYTDKERDNLRNAIKKIMDDIRLNRIPKEITLQ